MPTKPTTQAEQDRRNTVLETFTTGNVGQARTSMENLASQASSLKRSSSDTQAGSKEVETHVLKRARTEQVMLNVSPKKPKPTSPPPPLPTHLSQLLSISHAKPG